MYLIVFALIGLAASGVARWLGGKHPATSPRVSVIAGVLGALAGGVVGRMTGFHGIETKLAGVALSIIGSAVVLIIVGVLARGRGSRRNKTS